MSSNTRIIINAIITWRVCVGDSFFYFFIFQVVVVVFVEL